MARSTEQLLIAIDATTEQLRREMRRADQTVTQGSRRMDANLRRIDGHFQRVTRSVQSFAGMIGIAFGFRGLQRAIGSSLEMADGLQTMADRVDLSTTRLQELRFAADETNSSAEVLDSSLERFARRLGEARAGTGPLSSVVQELGIRTDDAGEAFLDIADAIANAEDSSDRLRIAQAALGEQGRELVDMLRLGRDGLDDMGREARETGRIIEADIIDRSAEVSRQMDRLQRDFRTAFQRGVLEGFTDEAERMHGVLADRAMVDNIENLGEAIGSLAETMLTHHRTITSVMAALAMAKMTPGHPAFKAVAGMAAGIATHQALAPEPDEARQLRDELDTLEQDMAGMRQRLEFAHPREREGLEASLSEMRRRRDRAMADLMLMQDDSRAAGPTDAGGGAMPRVTIPGASPGGGGPSPVELPVVPPNVEALRQQRLEAIEDQVHAFNRANDEIEADYLRTTGQLVAIEERRLQQTLSSLDEQQEAFEQLGALTAEREQQFADIRAMAHETASDRISAAMERQRNEILRASGEWQAGVILGLESYARTAGDTVRDVEQLVSGSFRGMEDAFVDFVTTGKASFSDLINSILADLARLTVRQAITTPIAGPMGAPMMGARS